MKRVFSQTFCVAAALLERDGKFLLVRESEIMGVDAGKWNQPAGWLSVGEDPIEAIKREVKGESGFTFEPKFILGIYSLVRSDVAQELGGTPHAVKILFLGDIPEKPEHKLAEDISETKWFTPEEIYAMDQKTLRDVDIKKIVKDYLAGKKYPLEILSHTVQIK